MRVLGLDVGDRRIGVAVSDSLGITAQGLESYTRGNDRATFGYFEKLVKQFEAEAIVIGLPLKLDGSEGSQAEKVRSFAKSLYEKTQIQQYFVDERFTTTQAERAMIEGGTRRQKRKESIDMVAACLILQGWLDRFRAAEGRENS